MTSAAPFRFASLERFVERPSEGRCELCAAPIVAQHPHVVDRTRRRILCACAACGFSFADVREGRFRTVPTRVRADRAGEIGPRELDALGVPVGLAFFFRPAAKEAIGVFPGPAGPTEAELPAEAWSALAAKSALVRAIADDVEALLVRREKGGRTTVFVVPIDVGYELTALLRRHYRGFDGGDDARRAVDDFFSTLAERAEAP